MTFSNAFPTRLGGRPKLYVSAMVLAALVCCAAPRVSAYSVSLPAAKALTVNHSQSVVRSLYGTSVPLRFGGRLSGLGTGRILGGVETEGTGAAQALSTGVDWRVNPPGLELLQLTGLQTGIEGADSQGSQFLGNMLAQLALGDSWYAPSLGLEVTTLSGQKNGEALSGDAFALSLSGPVAQGRYKLRMGRADDQFRPVGSLLPAGETMLDASFDYPLFTAHSVTDRFGLYQESVGPDPLTTWRNELQLTGPAPESWSGIDSLTWRAGGYARRSASGQVDDRALDLSVLTSWALGERWLISNALAWHEGFDPPVRGASQAQYYAWRFSGERRVGHDAYQGLLRPSFAVRRTVRKFENWDIKAGVELQLSRLTQHFSMHINYVSPRLRSALAPAQAGMQFLLQFKFNVDDARRLYTGSH